MNKKIINSLIGLISFNALSLALAFIAVLIL